MNIAKIQTLTTLVAYHEGEVEKAQHKLASLRRELRQAEDTLVGATEKLRDAKGALQKANAAMPIREVTCRERDIARFAGQSLSIGDNLPDEVWAIICAKLPSWNESL